MDAITPNLGLTKPDVGASDDTWGDKLNANFDLLDTADLDHVSIEGDTMTGSLRIAATGLAGSALLLQGNLPWIGMGDTGIEGSGIWTYSGTVDNGADQRWALFFDGAAETGGNIGSNFSILRYSDTGLDLGPAISINRASGVTTFQVSPSAPTPAPGDNDTSLATTAFVTAAVGTIVPGVPEAPIDSIQYARKNAAWTEVVQQSYGSAQNYLFNAGTVAPAAAGSVKLNNPTQNLSTVIYMSYITNDNPSGVNLKTYFLDRVKVGDTFYIQESNDPTRWKLFRLSSALVDNSTYATLPVTYVNGGIDLVAGRVVISREAASVASPVGEAPNDGVTYGRKNTAWTSLPNITVGTLAPATPAVNDVWIDTN